MNNPRKLAILLPIVITCIITILGILTVPKGENLSSRNSLEWIIAAVVTGIGTSLYFIAFIYLKKSSNYPLFTKFILLLYSGIASIIAALQMLDLARLVPIPNGDVDYHFFTWESGSYFYGIIKLLGYIIICSIPFFFFARTGKLAKELSSTGLSARANFSPPNIAIYLSAITLMGCAAYGLIAAFLLPPISEDPLKWKIDWATSYAGLGIGASIYITALYVILWWRIIFKDSFFKRTVALIVISALSLAATYKVLILVSNIELNKYDGKMFSGDSAFDILAMLGLMRILIIGSLPILILIDALRGFKNRKPI